MPPLSDPPSPSPAAATTPPPGPTPPSAAASGAGGDAGDAATRRIFVFDEVYPYRAAQEQAEKKKLQAFGWLARLNPLNRPRDDVVLLRRHELRHEPFWHLSARRAVDYRCEVHYPVPVHNPHAQHVVVAGRSHEVANKGGRRQIEMKVTETCHRAIEFDGCVDGLDRPVKPAALEALRSRYKYTERDRVDLPSAVTPTVPLTAARQRVLAALTREAINAHEIVDDRVTFERMHLYLRPVFAFEFVWSSADRTGVIEVDALTGDVADDGRWFHDKLELLLTRDNLVDLGAELAGAVVPGGGVAVRLADKLHPRPPG